MHSITINFEYKPKLHFSYGATSCYFLHDESFKKIIDASGLDICLSIAHIYETPTVEQIKSEKHVYGSLEAYLTLCLFLYKIYLQRFLNTNPLIERDTGSSRIDSTENLKNYKHHETVNYKMKH